MDYRYRITILRGNGSVWVEDCNNLEDVFSKLHDLVDRYPHLVISKQKLNKEEEA